MINVFNLENLYNYVSYTDLWAVCVEAQIKYLQLNISNYVHNDHTWIIKKFINNSGSFNKSLFSMWDAAKNDLNLNTIPEIGAYLNLSEILQLLPKPKEIGLDRNYLLHVARMIQMFETTRYIESFYLNVPYNASDYKTFQVLVTPTELSIYSLHNNLLCKLDLHNSSFLYTGRQAIEYSSILTYLKGSVLRFIQWTQPLRRSQEGVRRYGQYSWSWFLNKFENLENNIFNDISLINYKQYYMKQYNIENDVLKFLPFVKFELLNPYFIRFQNQNFLINK